MKRIFKIKLLPVVMVFLFFACGTNTSQKKETAEVKQESTALKKSDAGELAYKKHCMSCHQRDAGGIPKMYPPLANNKVVSGDKDELINIVLNGLSGEIEVNGEKYNGVMASYRNLSDAEIAGLLTYIRSNFDNEGDEIVAADVKALR